MPKGKKEQIVNYDPKIIPQNDKIIQEFLKLINQIKFEIDHAPSKSESMTNYYRLRQITSALDVIKKYPNEITKGED